MPVFHFLASFLQLEPPGQRWIEVVRADILVLFLISGEKLSDSHWWVQCSVQSLKSCPTLCDPMNRSTPGLPVCHQHPEFTQTHDHWVSDAIQPSHPLSSPSPPAPKPSQHQSFPMSQLFAGGGQSTGDSALASFLPKKSQGWSPSEWTGWISLQSKGLLRVFSNTTVQKHQFFSTQFCYSPTLTSIHDHWKNHSLDSMDLCWQSNVSAFQYAI